MLKWRLAVAALAAVAVVATGCSDTTEPTTTSGPETTVSGDDVVFGQGELPATIPDGFPVPAGSAIGSTMVIKGGLTEVVLRINAVPSLAAEFFDIGLAQGGFTVDSAAETDFGWLVEFNHDGTKGTIDITEPVEGVSQALVRFNLP